MTYVIWNPAWETGIKQIDKQHRQLLAQFEALMVAIHENQADDRIPGLLAFLSDYAETHFSQEEHYMQASRYPGFVGHKAIHDSMRIRVAEMVDSYMQDPASMTEEVLDFLTDWLVGHINEEDRRLAEHLNGFDAKGPWIVP